MKKRKSKDNRKPVFSVLAHVEFTDGKKKFAINSPGHWAQQVNTLQVGKKYGLTVEEYKATRSREQLAYYWVLLGYLAQETGYQPEELHEAIMRQKFGVKIVEIGDIRQEVRKSISDMARFPKGNMVELIQEVLDLCAQLGVHVPTKEELGYISNV